MDYIAVSSNPISSQNNPAEVYKVELDELMANTTQPSDAEALQIKIQNPAAVHAIEENNSVPPDSNLEYEELESIEGLKQYRCGLCGNICEDPVQHSKKHLDVLISAEQIVTVGVNVGIESPALSNSIQEVDYNPQQVIDVDINIIDYKCHHFDCNKVYKSKAALKQHILAHHTEGEVHSCPKCCKTFKTEYLLKKHLSVTCSDSKPHSCKVCGKSFKLMAKLKYHEGIHATVKPFKCPQCSKPMASKAHLKVHMEVHSNGHYSCFCGKTFNRVRKYKEHFKLQHDPNNPYRCSVCQKNLKNDQALETHKLTHNRPFACRVCKKGFLLEISCRLHEKKMHHMAHPDIADVESDTTCPICLKTFKNKKSTLEHMGVHTEGGEHKCRECDKVFKLKKHLRSHLKQHLERTLPCPECGKMFKHAKNLQLHIDTHKKPHACEQCGSRFSSEKGLKKHYQSHVEGRTPNVYRCPHCGKTFPSLSNAKLHLGEAHQDMPSISIVPEKSTSLIKQLGSALLTCAICRGTFSQLDDLQQHLQSSHDYPYLCQVCGKGFFQLFACKFHEKNEHNLEIPDLTELVNGRTCPVCGKSYKNKSSMLSHLSLHSDEGNHACDICGKVFKFKKNLNTHLISHAARSIPCTECGKKFKSERNLRAHLMSHSKPFECSTCGVSFSAEKYLRKHQENSGCSPKSFSCPRCLLDFDNFINLKVHVEEKHPNINSSHIMRVVEKNSNPLPKIFNCGICSDVFQKESLLASHELKRHSGEKRLKCERCCVLFISARTLHKHQYSDHKLGELCVCEVCKREFYNQNDLKLHVSVVHNVKDTSMIDTGSSKNSFKSLLSDFVKQDT